MSVIKGPCCNRRVTCSNSLNNARSESAIAINPKNPYNIVAVSKKFSDPENYQFSLAVCYTFDGGVSWTEASPLTLIDDWTGISDPALAWDDTGNNVYLVALPFRLPKAGEECTFDDDCLIGIAVYQSTDGGRKWGSPKLIHESLDLKTMVDDKQWAAGDPNNGHVYAAWDHGHSLGTSNLAFARTIDHGASWKGIKIGGVDQPAGTSLLEEDGTPIQDSGAPEISVAADGTIYIVWVTLNAIKFVKSTDGGDTFSPPTSVAQGVYLLPPHFEGATFRVYTLPTGCTAKQNNVIFAWADYGEGKSSIYYRRSTDGGSTWHGPDSGQPLLEGNLANPLVHDFHPQLISTPNGEIGCAFYRFFGTSGAFDAPKGLIHVYLAFSNNDGGTFSNLVQVTDGPWDPALGAPFPHGDQSKTFIGEYFGLDASRLGFFPLWTDTRTGMQELFMSRIAVNPTDVYIRDSASDVGDVPSPTNIVSIPDLILRNQPDGDTTFVDESVHWENQNYVYGRVANRGENTARNVRLVLTLVKYGSPSFTYPEDWYPGDWNQSQSSSHQFLGESSPKDIPANSQAILGPITWFPSGILSIISGYSLLAEVRADNDDSAGGLRGCEYPYDQGGCGYSTSASGSNNVCVRSHAGFQIPHKEADDTICRFVFKHCIFCPPTPIELILEKDIGMAAIPITLQMEKVGATTDIQNPPVKPVKLEFLDKSRFVVRMEDQNIGEISAAAGTVWQYAKELLPSTGTSILEEDHFGGRKIGKNTWKLTQLRAGVRFMAAPGETRNVILSFNTQKLKGETNKLRITQRDERKKITGSMVIDILSSKATGA